MQAICVCLASALTLKWTNIKAESRGSSEHTWFFCRDLAPPTHVWTPQETETREELHENSLLAQETSCLPIPTPSLPSDNDISWNLIPASTHPHASFLPRSSLSSTSCVSSRLWLEMSHSQLHCQQCSQSFPLLASAAAWSSSPQLLFHIGEKLEQAGGSSKTSNTRGSRGWKGWAGSEFPHP